MNQMSFNLNTKAKTGGTQSSDIFNSESEGPHILQVSQLNQMIRQFLENEFQLIWIQGEISNFKAHPSGHFYFSLKDNMAQVSAVMFKGFNRHLRFLPRDGLEVLIRGRVTVYEPRGSYQVFCETMEPLGAGSLQLAFEQLKMRLQKEGLFEESRKRKLPPFPDHVVLITAPSGAAIRDMLNVLNRRSRGLRVTVIPAIVQGKQAPGSIVQALERANRLKDADVIILGRGGGSIEDLWAFNDETVARAISVSSLPIISAVGHETDFTIADFVADLRAPTPSAAAELVVKNTSELVDKLESFERRLVLSVQRQFRFWMQRIQIFLGRFSDPRRKVRDGVFRCDELTDRLIQAMKRLLREKTYELVLLENKLVSPDTRIKNWRVKHQYLVQRLQHLMGQSLERSHSKWGKLTSLLHSLSPLNVVDRGYALVKGQDGRLFKLARDVVGEQEISIQMSDGTIRAAVLEIKFEERGIDK